MQHAAVVGAKAVVLVILVVTLFSQVIIIPGMADEIVFNNPEAAYLKWPGIVGCIAIVACAQVSMACIWRLLSMVTTSSIFQKSAFTVVNVIIATGVALTVLFVTAFVVLSIADAVNPGALIIIVVGAVGGAGLTLLVIVMKGLLRKATQLEQDMAEVV